MLLLRVAHSSHILMICLLRFSCIIKSSHTKLDYSLASSKEDEWKIDISYQYSIESWELCIAHAHWGKSQLFIQKSLEFCCLKNVNFVKKGVLEMWILSNVRFLKMWILWKMIFWKCELCEKWDFEIVNFVENDALKLFILWKMIFWKCDFCKKWDFENVNFVKNDIFVMWFFG